MSRKKAFVIIWVVVNLILALKYFWDCYGIQCESCLSEADCPPCQTDFMASFWWYLIIWNITMLLIKLSKRNKTEKRVLTATTTDLGNWLNGKMVLYLDV